MILLTGATGTIGKAIVAALQARRQDFKVAARNPKKVLIPGTEIVEFDWDDHDAYPPAMQGIDKLFLLTPNSARQVGYVLQAVAAAKRAKVRHIVRLSVLGTDADPGIILGRQHFAAEREIKASGLLWTMLRPTFFMQNFISYYGVDPARDSEVRLPHGNGKASWVDADDVGAVAAEVLITPAWENKVLELTGPEALSAAEVLAILGEALGHKYTYIDCPEDEARTTMENMKMPLWLVDGFMELHGLIKSGNAAHVSDGVKKVLGREPHSVRDWAKRLVAPV